VDGRSAIYPECNLNGSTNKKIQTQSNKFKPNQILLNTITIRNVNTINNHLQASNVLGWQFCILFLKNWTSLNIQLCLIGKLLWVWLCLITKRNQTQSFVRVDQFQLNSIAELFKSPLRVYNNLKQRIKNKNNFIQQLQNHSQYSNSFDKTNVN